jgi:hypothetical protein
MGREGRQDAAALRYCCAVAFLEVSEFYQLPHGVITPHYVGYEVLTAVIMKIAIFCDIELCSPYMNRRFGGTYQLHLQLPKSA